MAMQCTRDTASGRSIPRFDVGDGIIVPVAHHVFETCRPYVSSTTKIGTFKYVKRRFDFHSLRVLSEEDKGSPSSSNKRTADGERKVSGGECDSGSSQNIGEAWVDADAVDHNGYITSIIKPLSAKTSYYTYYSAGPESPLPDLQMAESALNCEDSLNFRSKMYCQNERDRLSLPYEIRCMIYAHAFSGFQPASDGQQPRRAALEMLKILPLVCRFLYVDMTHFINREHFQLYFRHPLMLQAYFDKLDLTRSPFSKRQLNLTRLRCVILDLDKHSHTYPDRSLLIPHRPPHLLWNLQQRAGFLPQPTLDPVNWAIRSSATCVSKADGRSPADWAAALEKLLQDYEIGKLVLRIGKGNTMKWKKLPQRVREVVGQGANKAVEWQVVMNVGGWKAA